MYYIGIVMAILVLTMLASIVIMSLILNGVITVLRMIVKFIKYMLKTIKRTIFM